MLASLSPGITTPAQLNTSASVYPTSLHLPLSFSLPKYNLFPGTQGKDEQINTP